jgi:hypothetical protein
MNRLLWWHWLLIGVGASLVLFLILFFAVIRPKNLEAEQVNQTADGIETAGGTEDKVNGKKRDLKKAKDETVRINNDWKIQSARYMPAIEFPKDPLPGYEGVQNLGVYYVGGKAYGVKDLPAVWGRWIGLWYAAQSKTGITPLTSFPIEAFSPDPNDISNLKSISFPQSKPWDVEVVAKDFDAAMNHLRRFNTISQHGMPVVDKVSMAGQSPDLHLKYTLQLFVIPPGEPPAPDPTISSSGGSAGGGPGGPGGGPGAMGSGGMMMPSGGAGKGKMGSM